jgi:hypothetical protein
VIAAWRFGGADAQDVQGLQQAKPTTRVKAAPAPLPSGTARLEVIATRGDSYVIARRGGAIGRVEYSGTIEKGQRQRFEGKVLWLQIRSPRNVLVRLNGNRVKVPAVAKTDGVFVTAKRVFVVDPS